MIKSIYLENWKTHLNSKLSFQKGTNILLGVIGSGKSSVVDAICYALYGTFPTLSNRKVSLDETIMFKPIKKEYFKIVLELEHDDKIYTIEREVFSGNKANSAKMYLEGKLIAGPKKGDVDSFVSNLLGIDYNLFIKVVYSQQNEIDYFLKIAPSKRKEQFDDLFGISHFDSIKTNTREINRLLTHEIDKKELLLKQINEQIKSLDFSELKEKEAELIFKKTNLEKDILELDKNIKEFSLKLKEKKDIKQKFEKTSSELTLNTSRLKDVELEIYNLRDEIVDEVTLEQLNKEKDDFLKFEKDFREKQTKNKEFEISKKSLENKIYFYKNNFSQLEDKIKALNESLVVLEVSKEDVFKNKKEASLKINDLEVLKKTLLSKEKELNHSLVELSKGYSNCPICNTPFTKEKLKESILHVEYEIKKIPLEIKEIEKRLDLENSKLEGFVNLENTFEKNKNIEKQIEDHRKNIVEINYLLDQAHKEIASLPRFEDLSSLEKEVLKRKELLKTKEDFLNLNNKKNNLLKLIETLKKEVLHIKYDPEEHLNFLAESKNLESSQKNLNETLKTVSFSLESLKKQIINYSSLNKQGLEIEDGLKKVNLKQQDLSYFLKAIDNSQLQLRRVLIDNINQALSIIWPKVYPYKDYLSARLNADNDYILEVLTIKNDWIRVEGLLSGGERACASLSIRIAISLILTKKLGLLILDEPTHNLDEKTINALSNILEAELPDLVDQIFIVTHDNLLLDTVNANKYIIERDKENDSASKVN